MLERSSLEFKGRMLPVDLSRDDEVTRGLHRRIWILAGREDRLDPGTSAADGAAPGPRVLPGGASSPSVGTSAIPDHTVGDGSRQGFDADRERVRCAKSSRHLRAGTSPRVRSTIPGAGQRRFLLPPRPGERSRNGGARRTTRDRRAARSNHTMLTVHAGQAMPLFGREWCTAIVLVETAKSSDDAIARPPGPHPRRSQENATIRFSIHESVDW
jgi:hypothetical protein